MAVGTGPNWSYSAREWDAAPFAHQPVFGVTFDAGLSWQGTSAPTGGPLPPHPIVQQVFQGTSGDDHFSGTTANDTFNLQDGGNDTAAGGSGNDNFFMGASLTNGDLIAGADPLDPIPYDGYDRVFLNGDYNLTFTHWYSGVDGSASSGLFQISEIDLQDAHNYTMTTDDDLVGTGATMVVGGSGSAANTIVWDGNQETDGHFTFFGADEQDIFTGGSLSDTAYGGAGNDIFGLWRGGNDTVYGGNGNDDIRFYNALTAADTIDGGAGNDTLSISNFDYINGFALFFTATTMVNVETLQVGAGNSYSIFMSDGNVAAGQDLTVDASALGSSNSIDFEGANETDGRFVFYGGAGADIFRAGHHADIVYGGGGADTVDFRTNAGADYFVNGGDGDDNFLFGAGLTATDVVDGGAGSDTVTIAGDYTGANALTLGATGFSNVEKIEVLAGSSYTLTTNNADVAAGQTLAIDGSALSISDVLTFNGGSETDGAFSITGGLGNDALTGGAGADRFDLSKGGNDTVITSGGADTLYFGAAYNGNDVLHLSSSATAVIELDGDYSAGVTATAGSIDPANSQRFQLDAGHSYKLTFAAGSIPFPDLVPIVAAFVGASNYVTIDATAVTGSINVTGGPSLLSVHGGAGDDAIIFPSGLPIRQDDVLDGGAGVDQLVLYGDYSAGFTFAATTLVSIEYMHLNFGSFNLTTNDANVAAGSYLSIGFDDTNAAHTLTFDGSQETNGTFFLHGGFGNDVLTGGAKNDTFDATRGGNDTLKGGKGNDAFQLGASLAKTDVIDGGAGNDVLSLDGDYSGGVVFGKTTLKNVETIALTAGHSYMITTADKTVANAATLVADGSALGAGNAFTFDGANESDGTFDIRGGAGNDTLTGGALGDLLKGGLGADTLDGRAGTDTFVYASATDSTGTAFDIVKGFDASADKFDLWVAVNGVDATIASGRLRPANFNADMAAAADAAHLGAHHAVLFTPTHGGHAGETFLVIDVNGTAGYQANQDLVVQLESAVNVALTTGNFI